MRPRIALGRIPVASAASGLYQKDIARVHSDPYFLGAEGSGARRPRMADGEQPVAMCGAVPPSKQTIRRVADAVAGGVGARRPFDLRPHLQHGAHTPAKTPRTSGVGPELVPLEE